MSVGAVLAVGHGAVLQAVAALPGGGRLPVLGALAGATDPSPSPSSTTIEIPPEDQTSPGFLGFLVTFGVAVVVILLGFSLVRHLRVVERNARRREAEDGTGGPGPHQDAGAVAGAVPIAIGDPAAEDAAAAAGSPAAAEPGTGVEAADLAEDAIPGPDEDRTGGDPR